MLRRCFSFTLIFLSAVLAFSQSNEAVNTTQILQDFNALTNFYPRTPGSEGERQSIDYLISRLSKMDANYTLHPLSEMEDGHSYSTNIEVSLGKEREEELIIAVPLNHPLSAGREESGAINLALALGIIEDLIETDLSIALRIIFLGNDFDGPQFGTRQFLSTYAPEQAPAVIRIDLPRIPERVLIRTGSNGIVSPYWLLNLAARSMDSGGLFYLIRGNENQIFRLGLGGTPGAIGPFLEMDFPSILLEGTGDAPTDELEHREWIWEFIQSMRHLFFSLEKGTPDTWDRHYLFFQIRSFSFIISEGLYIMLFLMVISGTLLYPLIARKRFKRYLKIIASDFWTLPVLVLLTFLFHLLGTLLIQLVMVIRDYPNLWSEAPLLFFILKMSATVGLSALLFRFIKRLPLSRNGSFYTASAILFLLLNILIIAFLDISLTYYLIWAFLFTFLFSLARNRWVKTLLFFGSTLLFMKAAIDVFTLPALDVIRVLLISSFKGNFLLAMNLMPFLFMLIRLDFMFLATRKQPRRVLFRSSYVLLGAVTVGLFLYLNLYPIFSLQNPQEVLVTEIIDLDKDSRKLHVESEAPLEGIEIIGENYHFIPENSAPVYEIPGGPAPDLLKLTSEGISFLDRRAITITINTENTPLSVQADLISHEDLILYDANFPYTPDPGGKRIEIHIGMNPPIPLVLELTIPEGVPAFLYLGITFDSIDDALTIKGKHLSVKKQRILTHRVPLSPIFDT